MKKKALFIVLILLYFSNGSYTQDTISTAGIDKESDFVRYLTIREAQELIRNYKVKKWNWHRRWMIGKRFDAGSCWFDITKFYQFIKIVNKQLDSSGIKVSGFRLYYIAYGRKKNHVPTELTTAGINPRKMHSLLIVPTIYDRNTKRHVDYILNKDNVVAFKGIENQGTLCPPLPPEKCSGAILLQGIYPQRE